MIHPGYRDFGLIIPSVADGTRPVSGIGTSVTPGNNAFGTYAQVLAGASVTSDAFGILININGGSTSAAARDMLLTIGIDPAGGTSYTDFIESLACPCSSNYASGGFGDGGIEYFFPVRIPAGASIAAKASVNNGTVGTVRCFIKLFCKPNRSDIIVGTFVQTFGATPASSSGTALTPGTVSEGSFVEIGTLTKPLWFLEYGLGVNDAALNNNVYHTDLAIGDATNKKILIHDAICQTASTEQMGKRAAGARCVAAIGDKIYGRSQVGPNAGSAALSIIAYGVG